MAQMDTAHPQQDKVNQIMIPVKPAMEQAKLDLEHALEQAEINGVVTLDESAEGAGGKDGFNYKSMILSVNLDDGSLVAVRNHITRDTERPILEYHVWAVLPNLGGIELMRKPADIEQATAAALELAKLWDLCPSSTEVSEEVTDLREVSMPRGD